MRRSCLGWDALGGMAGSSEAERSAYNRLSEGSSPSYPPFLTVDRTEPFSTISSAFLPGMGLSSGMGMVIPLSQST